MGVIGKKSPKDRHFFRNRLFLSLISTLVALICAEGLTGLYFRIVDPTQWAKRDLESSLEITRVLDNRAVLGALDQFDDFGQPSKSQRVLHPYLGYVKNYVPETSYNKYGFLGPETVQKRSPDTIIIGLFGGSVAQDFYYKSGEYFTKELSQYSKYSGKHIILVPLTQDGYKQPQHLLALSYFLSLGGQFDIVITIDGVNELIIPVSNSRDFGITPSYPLDWIAFSQMGINPEIAPLIYIGQHILTTREDIRQFMVRSWVKRFNLGILIWGIIDKNLGYLIYTFDQTLDKKLSSGSLSYQTKGIPMPQTGNDEYFHQLAQIWSQSSRQMHYLAMANGIRYYHYLQPNQYVLGSKNLSSDELKRAYLIDESDGKTLRPGYSYLQSEGNVMRADGVPYTDLTGLFGLVTDTIYIDTCCHMNTKGNNIMADAIIRDIVK